MRIRPLVVALMLVVTACGEAEVGSATPVETTSSPAETNPSSSVAAAPTTTGTTALSETPTTGPAPDPDRVLAPDFMLTLSDGTEYQLANEVRPVYLVFWAEW